MSESGPTVLGGRYELHRRLGRGGTSEIFLARDQLLDRPVAVKVLFREFATDPSFVERFRREAQSAAGLNHPNIVGVYDWANEDGTYYLVLEYVEGRSLVDIVRTGGALPAEQSAIIASDICSALSFAHRNGVVHRDIKPGNVMVSSDGNVKVTDFGIARAVSADTANDLTQAGTVMGTATYFSPEQAQGNRVDHRSDLYSLGVTMYEMVAGRPPFSGDTPVAVAYKHVQEQPQPLIEVAPDTPADFAAIVMRLLSKSPDDRYVSADALRDDILRFRDGESVSVLPTVVLGDPSAGEPAGVDAHDATLAGSAVAGGVAASSGPAGHEPAPIEPAVPVHEAAAPTAMMERPGSSATVESAPPPRQPPISDEVGPDYVEQPRRAGTGVFIAAIVALLGLLAILLFLLAQAVQVDGGSDELSEVEVPDVIDQQLDRARDLLEGELGLRVEIEETVNESFDPGVVFAQEPGEGFKVTEGATVKLSVAQAESDLVVPPVIGLDRIEAERAFFEAGISATRVNPRGINSDEDIDIVLSQQPPARTSITPDDEVSFTFSTGPEAREIPDLAGRTPADASNVLGRLGFNVVQEDEIDETIDEGTVIRTEPAAFEDADPAETTIVIVVARARPDVSVPNVIQRTEQRANDILIGAGYSISATYQDLPPDDQRIGRVLEQSPGPDDIVEGGEQVLIVVGQAGDPSDFTTTTSTPDPNDTTTSTDTTLDPTTTSSTDTTVDPTTTSSTDTTTTTSTTAPTSTTVDPATTSSTDTTTTTSSTTTTTTVDPNNPNP